MAPIVFGPSTLTLNFSQTNENPSLQHLLGTDRLGRDVLLRVLIATRLSLLLALAATTLAAVLGIPAGAGAALLPGRLRAVALRAIDTMLAFPALVVALFIGAVLGSGSGPAALGVGIALSFGFARVASTLALSIGGRDFIQATRALGISGPRLLFRHVLPNVGETLAIQVSVALSVSIVAVSSLSFLGLGAQPPLFDWGSMLTDGVRAFYLTPASALGPAAAIAIASLAFGLTGEAYARASNPMLWSGGRSDPSRAHRPPASVMGSTGHLREGRENLKPPAAPALEVKGLTVRFPGETGPVTVVDGVSFEVGRGEMLGIVGESGSGKTMTALAIGGLVPHPGTVSGGVSLGGQDLARLPHDQLKSLLGTELAVVFQDPMSSLNPALKIGRQMTEAAETHRHLSGSASHRLAARRLGEVNIPAPEMQLERHPHQLSGGMRQRVMIAMGLMNEPVLLMADEPTTALDVTIQAQIMDLLHEINQEHGTAIILISHNLGLISQNCNRVAVMYAGRLVELGTAAELLRAPLHPYTQALLAAVPDPARPRDMPLQAIPGQMADPAALPSGCAYHPRCPLATEQCRRELPPLRARTGGRQVACWVANQDLGP
jgi:oligopeptide/dipeptide ABC transporter ATP-binding protein